MNLMIQQHGIAVLFKSFHRFLILLLRFLTLHILNPFSYLISVDINVTKLSSKGQ